MARQLLNNSEPLLEELAAGLATSNAAKRKHWAERLHKESIPLAQLFSLWHAEQKTAQRFMWFIGDLVDFDPDIVEPSIEFLFALRDEMPFPGMHRSVAKWLWRTNVPEQIERPAIKQLRSWLVDPAEEIGCKHYSSHALIDLVNQGRFSRPTLKRLLRVETDYPNPAYAARARKMLAGL